MKYDNPIHFNLGEGGFGRDVSEIIPKILFHFFANDVKDINHPLQVCLNGMDLEISNYVEALKSYFPAVIRFTYDPRKKGHLRDQLIEFSNQFIPSESYEDDEVLVEKAHRWFEENKSYLIVFDTSLGLDLENPPKDIPFPRTHKDYFILNWYGWFFDRQKTFEQFNVFSQLSLFRLVLDEKSHFGESRSWESFFENTNILNLESWIDGSWSWDDEQIINLTSTIFGDAIGKLAGRGKENEEIASFVRRTSFEVKNWEDIVPCFLTSLLSLEKLWNTLGYKSPYYLLEKIRAEKRSLMKRDSWPYSEKMGDFTEYLPEDTDFKKIIKTLPEYKKKYKKGYEEFQELDEKEKAILEESNVSLDAGDEEFALSENSNLDLHLALKVNAKSLDIYGVLVDGDCDQKDAFYFRLNEEGFSDVKAVVEELRPLGNALLEANQVCVHGQNGWICLLQILNRSNCPLEFLLRYKFSKLHRFQFKIQENDRPIQVWNEFTHQIENNSKANNNLKNLDVIDQSPRYTAIEKEISYQSSEDHQYFLCELRSAIRNKNKNLLNLYCAEDWPDSTYTSVIDINIAPAIKEILRKFANFQKGEVIYDPDAGRGHLLHWFAGHFSHKSETGFPRYTAANEKANDFYQIAEYLIKGSLEDKSLQASFQWGDISGGRQHDLMLSDTSKAFTNYLSHSKLEHCYDRLGEHARGLFFMDEDLEIEEREVSKIRKEIIADGSLKLVVQILDKADCYLLYIERSNPTKTVNFLHLQTAEEVKNFLRDESDPTRFTRPVEDLSTVSGYQFWQASRDDILKTKEIDLMPARWKPKELAHVISSGGAEAGLPQEFSRKIRLDIEKDLSLLDEIESLQTQLVSIALEEKKMEDLFEVHLAKDFKKREKPGNISEAELRQKSGILCGTGFKGFLGSPPTLLDYSERTDFVFPGLVLAISRANKNKNKKGFFQESKFTFSDRHYFLDYPLITCNNWSADRSVVALVPKREMTMLELEYFKYWFYGVGWRSIYGLDERLDGFVNLIGLQKIPCIEENQSLGLLNSLFGKFEVLCESRLQPDLILRDYIHSLFETICFRD